MGSSGAANSAVAITTWFEASGMSWASTETKMSLYNVRLHLRVLRRVSLAVLNPATPAYDRSALFF